MLRLPIPRFSLLRVFTNKSRVVSGTQNAGTEPFKAIFWVDFHLHTPYIQLM